MIQSISDMLKRITSFKVIGVFFVLFVISGVFINEKPFGLAQLAEMTGGVGIPDMEMWGYTPQRVFDILTVAILGAVALMFVLNVPSWFYTVIVIPIVAVVIFFVFLLVIGKVTTKNRYIGMILTLLDEIRRASLSLQSIIILSASSIVIWLLDVLVCVAVVMMFQQQIPFAVVVLAIVIGNLVKAVPITPGGVGTYELSVAITFEQIASVSPAIAFLIAVIDHLIKNMITLVGGIISIYYLGDWVIPTIRKAIHSKLEGGKNPEP